jgi:prefoldin subunit 5
MTMNSQATNKPAEKSSPKTNMAKPGADPEKAINQLKQEIRTLSKAVKEMQQKSDTQEVIVTMPQKLFSKANAYLSDIESSVGLSWSLSTLMCEALDLYLWGEEQNKRIEEERERTELDNRKKE